mgnify:CR=1 FL=1
MCISHHLCHKVYSSTDIGGLFIDGLGDGLYLAADEDKSTLVTTPITTKDEARIKGDTSFALAVAGFGQLLKDDKYMADFGYDDVLELAKDGKGDDPYGYRTEFMNLVRLAETLDDNQ